MFLFIWIKIIECIFFGELLIVKYENRCVFVICIIRELEVVVLGWCAREVFREVFIFWESENLVV